MFAKLIRGGGVYTHGTKSMRQTVTYDKTGDDGRFEPTFEREEFLDAVDDLELPTTAEIAESVGCAHRTALHHLNNLEERGDLDSRMIGRAKVWSIDDTDETASNRRESDPSPAPTETSAEYDSIRAAVEATGEIPNDVDVEDATRAVGAVVEYLETTEDRKATMREIVASVMPSHPLKYDVDAALAKIEAGDRYRGGWWRLVIKPTLEAYDGVEAPPRGGSYWALLDDE